MTGKINDNPNYNINKSNLSIAEILQKDKFNKGDIINLLSIELQDELEILRKAAFDTMINYVGEKVYLRGLVEFSNICINDCYYCGIRRSNNFYKRYTLTPEEILREARICAEKGYGSIVLQSGDRNDDDFVDFVAALIKKIKLETQSELLPLGLGITLCIGEQDYESYKKLFDAGAHRYLLRIETTNPELFARLHPPEQEFSTRIECLEMLKDIGYQVGTGVMIGLPGQSLGDLANDILFFEDYDVDMIGMGPYIVHENTPMAEYRDYYNKNKNSIFKLALKMIAVTRLVLKDVNIASTTALQAIKPFGREAGLNFGANIIMPLMTSEEWRQEYQLYEGKPCIDESTDDCHYCIESRIQSINREIGFNEWGDSRHIRKLEVS
jgi:biotin synthase